MSPLYPATPSRPRVSNDTVLSQLGCDYSPVELTGVVHVVGARVVEDTDEACVRAELQPRDLSAPILGQDYCA